MRDWRWGPGTRSPSRVPGGWLTTWRFTSRIYRHLPLKGSKRETIEKIPKPLRHKTYSSKRQPEFGKTREKYSYINNLLYIFKHKYNTIKLIFCHDLIM